LCRVLSEESVAKGVRRITAVTGPRALAQVRETEAILRAAAAALKVPRLDEVPKKIEALHEELRRLKLESEKQHAQSAVHRADALVENARTISGVRVIVAQVDLPDVDGLRALVDQLRRKASPSAAVLLASAAEGKVTLIAGLTPEAMARGLHAGDLVKAAAQAAGGGGGGRPDLAQAGGKDPSRIPAALEAGMAYLVGKLG
jgi:alanyl-tRNA synthetase